MSSNNAVAGRRYYVCIIFCGRPVNANHLRLRKLRHRTKLAVCLTGGSLVSQLADFRDHLLAKL